MALYYILPTLLTSAYLAALYRQRLGLGLGLQQTQQRVELCIYSEDTSLFQNQCVDCSLSLFSQTVMGCAGAPSLPANISYDQATCLIEQCTQQIPYQRYPRIIPDISGGDGGDGDGDGDGNGEEPTTEPTDEETRRRKAKKKKTKISRNAKITRMRKPKNRKVKGKGKVKPVNSKNKPKPTPRNTKKTNKNRPKTTRRPTTAKPRGRREAIDTVLLVKKRVFTFVRVDDLING